jgi:hypothetical protein
MRKLAAQAGTDCGKKTSWQSRLFFLQKNAHMESGTDNT